MKSSLAVFVFLISTNLFAGATAPLKSGTFSGKADDLFKSNCSLKIENLYSSVTH